MSSSRIAQRGIRVLLLSRSRTFVDTLKLSRRCRLHVAVGMSGGVDSSVSAHLLKTRGHRVTGVFMRNWDAQDETGVCSVDEDLADAKHAAQVLGIELKEVDFSKEYWNQVFTYVLHDYENGRTPNPDIVCNQLIKFKVFLEYARDVIGADALATGHYARTNVGDMLDNVPRLDESGEPVRLFKGIDPGKDQSFFLSRITQTALRHVLFPVGGMYKKEVKRIASEIGLNRIANKDESMGICFIGSRRFKSFINDYIVPTPGNFRHIEDGSVVAQHSGVHQWTIGQRIRLGGCKNALFVVSRDPKNHDIIVANGTHHPALYSFSMEVGIPHWISGKEDPDIYSTCDFTRLGFRFQHNNVGVTHPCCLFPVSEENFPTEFGFENMELLDSSSSSSAPTPSSSSSTTSLASSKAATLRYIVRLSEPIRALTPGQFAVFYRGDECIGSACIMQPGPSLWDLSQRGSHRVEWGESGAECGYSLGELQRRRRLVEEERRAAADALAEQTRQHGDLGKEERTWG